MAETDGRLVTVAQYDAAIERLTKARAAAKSVIGNPVQRNRRHRRRALLIGLGMTKAGWTLTVDFTKTKLLSQLRKGDVLVVWTLRSPVTLPARCTDHPWRRVQERHAGFRSLKEAVDTTTPAGRMMMQMVGAFAEFERAMLKERTKAGLDAARKEGRIGGRPPKLKPHQQQEIVTLVKQGKKTAADAARLFGVHPATVSRLLRRT